LELRIAELVIVEERVVPLGRKHRLKTRKSSGTDWQNVLKIFAPVVCQCQTGPVPARNKAYPASNA
jgi:hypothetical protein